ncbi:hypothetical protein DMB66_19425 [Actinoplanes sp. ATCC 53533]|uniref:hypothetical protein n=1 Tax=Actinoplanes sp. ATCC 53533 TaxID=1288362 RepID=UPI000F766420|nr:hypothetical protein [Actinoplanes sp. ATCC 53533]RSM64504.1 hypothetical protein DMB66_19425 [Actinoplanes sp. ATCC 53533]
MSGFLNLALLGLLFGALATAIGAATGKGRATVFGLIAGLGVATYACTDSPRKSAPTRCATSPCTATTSVASP